MTGLFIPEALTPLAFTPVYAAITDAQRLAYNRLHGQYFLEQTIWFEQVMGRPTLDSLEKMAPPPELLREIRQFAAEEDAHSGWFRTLLREVRPGVYEHGDFDLLAARPGQLRSMRLAARSVRWLPALLWLQLIAEERALYFGKVFLAERDALDPRFYQVQMRHMADEAGHVRRDEMFLRWRWPATPRWGRCANAAVLEWMLREFFYLPKRSGWRVVETWLADHPELEPRRSELRAAWHGLADTPAFVRTLYPRRHLSRTVALAADWPELGFFNSFFSD
jgi:P-aminobenzoate N-oxygenase AurF